MNGETSGSGSYGHLAEFKADILNRFVSDKKLTSVCEFGFGDGNQLSLSNYPKFIGYEVSQKAVELCRNRFSIDPTKSFHLVSEWKGDLAELAISLDVIYHLVEDLIFEEYMHRLFNASSKFVIIYSSNTNENLANQSIHVKHRKFSDWVEHMAPEWRLTDRIPNKFPYKDIGDSGSFADFYIYEKQE